MNLSESLHIAPRPARIVAAIFVVCGTLGGLVAGFFHARPQLLANQAEGPLSAYGPGQPFLSAIIGLVGGLFVSGLFAIWILGLGYVYGDARRRNMPAIPWALAAALIPNLLGFLLYFVLRRPLASPCPRCGQAITPDQRFCSWCGYQRPRPTTEGFVPPRDPAHFKAAPPTQV